MTIVFAPTDVRLSVDDQELSAFASTYREFMERMTQIAHADSPSPLRDRFDAHLGTERGREKAFGDLGVGEGLALSGAAFGDLRIFGCLRERAGKREEEKR